MTAGVYLSYFNKGITDGKRIFSIKVLFKWDPNETEKKKKERRNILDEIQERGQSQAILISNFMERKVLQAHAYTVKLLPTGWVLLDSFYE